MFRRIKYLVSYSVYFCYILMAIYLNIGHIDFLANVRMLKFGYGIRSPNVRTLVDIPNNIALKVEKNIAILNI